MIERPATPPFDPAAATVTTRYDELLHTVEPREAVLASYTPDAAFHFLGNHRLSGSYFGHDGIIEFYDRTEPASPVPYLARRMRRMVPMDFIELMADLAPVLDANALLEAQRDVLAVHVSAAIIDYCHAILHFTRNSERFVHGLSPRAGLGLLRAARAWALLAGRDFVLPEDIQRVLPAVVPHRLVTGDDDGARGHAAIAELILESVPVS